ncbi:MAG TPA: hypothetical protein VFL57_00325 [Bryobacteraceae bacterium]|nr:hypothetical protein [Bryobacteraceae bacterium]
MLAAVLRVYSYLYHLVLSLFLLGISGIVLASGNHNLQMPMLPWEGDRLTQWLFWGSVFGLLSAILAVTGVFRYLFPLWALVVLVIMVRGFLLGPYRFGGPDSFYRALTLIFGALLAFLASLTVFRARRRRLR